MGYWGWKPYVSVAERRKKAEKAAAKAKKAGAGHSPIEPYRGAIAKTFWGKAWCDNLERYSDYANRLPRGRTYVRNGSVIDLKIAAGEVRAQVMGSSLYKVDVTVAAVADKQWQSIGADCSGSIDSLVELLQGKLSKAVMERICTPGTGLFPAPKEIQFSCSCPDWASMCKHVAAVLYGVGARLDQQPELLFNLRRVDAKDLVAQASTALPKTRKGSASKRVLDDSALADVFGIEMVEATSAVPVKKKPGKSPVTKKTKLNAETAAKTTSKKRSESRKSEPSNKVPATKPVKAATPAKASGGSRKTTAEVPVSPVKRARTPSAPKPRQTKSK
jgi:uncharacterized Zn finger protein